LLAETGLIFDIETDHCLLDFWFVRKNRKNITYSSDNLPVCSRFFGDLLSLHHGKDKISMVLQLMRQ
jgi:hypothetical protein